jgi:hypothetical protein
LSSSVDLVALNLVTDTLELELTHRLQVVFAGETSVSINTDSDAALAVGKRIILGSKGQKTGRTVDWRSEVIGTTRGLVRSDRVDDTVLETGAELERWFVPDRAGHGRDETHGIIWHWEGEKGDTIGGLGDVTLMSQSGLGDNRNALLCCGLVITTVITTTINRGTSLRETTLLATLAREGHEDERYRLVSISGDTRSLTESTHSHGTAREGGRWTVLEGLRHDLNTWHRLVNTLHLVSADILHVDIAILVETVREGSLELLDTLGGGDDNATIINGLEQSGTAVNDLTVVRDTVGDTVEELVTEANVNSHAHTETGVEFFLLGGGRVVIELLRPLSVEEVNGGDESELDGIETVVEGNGERVTLIHNLETVVADSVIAQDLLVEGDGELHDIGIPLPEGGGTLNVSDDDGHLTLRRLSLRGELWVGGTTIEDDITGKLDVERHADERLRVRLHAREDGRHDTGRPDDDNEAAEELITELTTTRFEIFGVEPPEDTTRLVSKETHGSTAPDSTSTVDRRGIERIVDLEGEKCTGSSCVDHATNDARDDGTEWVEDRGTSSHGDTSSKHTVHEGLEVDEARLDEHDTKGRKTTSGGTNGSDSADTTSEGRVATGGGKDGATVETEPSEHEEETTGTGEHEIVRLEEVDLTVLREASITRTDNGGETEGNNATSKVDNARASEVEEREAITGAGGTLEGASIDKPGVAGPAPVDNTWVDERGETHGGDEVTLEGAALSTGSGDNGTGSRGERPLEEPHSPHSVGRSDAVTEVVVLATKVTEGTVLAATAATAVDVAGVTESERVANNEPEDSRDEEINGVLYTNGLGVLSTDATDLEKHESDLHQEHEHSVRDEPEGIDIVCIW